MTSSYREETDFLGVAKVPEHALFGIFTKRAGENFKISGVRIDKDFIETLAEIKKTAAITNAELGLLEYKYVNLIVKAADEVISGIHSEEFPLDVFQAGAGTPWNMNMNEVLANRANQILGYKIGAYKPIHPNDHVNLSQSSNDVIPNTIRITSLRLLKTFFKTLLGLEDALTLKAEEFSDVLKSGRTHMRDAVPICLGQEFKAYSVAVAHGRKRIQESARNLERIFLGGTAVGTGLNTHPDYSKILIRHLRDLTSFDLKPAEDFIEKTQFKSDFLDLMNSLCSLSVDLIKICNDLMLLSSGPQTGLKELMLPAVELGSSIMPGKVNPSILECFNMVLFQVLGNKVVVENAAKFGTLEINVYTPVIAFNVFNSINWLTNALNMLTTHCIKGIKVNKEVTTYYLQHSNAIATLLSPITGYEKAAMIANDAKEKGVSVKDLIIQEGLLTKDEVEELIKHSCEPNMHIIQKILDCRSRTSSRSK
jgi:aspartate ammonia-lyase